MKVINRWLLLTLLLSCASTMNGFAQVHRPGDLSPRLVPANDEAICRGRYPGWVDACNRVRRAEGGNRVGGRAEGGRLLSESNESSFQTWTNTADGRAACWLLGAGACDAAQGLAKAADGVAATVNRGADAVADVFSGAADSVDRVAATVNRGADAVADALFSGAADSVDLVVEWASGTGTQNDADVSGATPTAPTATSVPEWEIAADAAAYGGSAYGPTGSDGWVEAEPDPGYSAGWSADPEAAWSMPAAGVPTAAEGAAAYRNSTYGPSEPGGWIEVEPSDSLGLGSGPEWTIPAGAPAGAEGAPKGAPAYYDSGPVGCSGLTDCQLINGDVVAGPSLNNGVASSGSGAAWQPSLPTRISRDEVDAMRARLLDEIADDRSRGRAEMAAIRERQGSPIGGFFKGFFKGLGSVAGGIAANSDVITGTLLQLQQGGDTSNLFRPGGIGSASMRLDADVNLRFDCNQMFADAKSLGIDTGMSMSDCQEARSIGIKEGFFRSDGSYLSPEEYQRMAQEMMRDEERRSSRPFIGRSSGTSVNSGGPSIRRPGGGTNRPSGGSSSSGSRRCPSGHSCGTPN